MTSDLPESADLLLRVRQQLILAQVRIMELEDIRDELSPRLAEVEALLAEAQTLADRKTDEADHLDRVRNDLQAQLQHLRHVQHVTNEALEIARHQAGVAEAALVREQVQTNELRAQCASLRSSVASLEARLAETGRQLERSQATSSRRADRIGQLDSELRAMKTSRSWRWTAWLRSIERLFRRPS